MKNIFIEYPEFIDTDPRRLRPNTGPGYNVNAEFQYQRHCVAMPKELVSGQSVLDLGCCVGATGAWVLANGATRYVGVELQAQLGNSAKQNLAARYTNQNWEIKQQSFTEFFQTNLEQFDIVIMFGVLYHSIYFESLIKNVVDVSPTYILVDSINPLASIDPAIANRLMQYPLIEYVENRPMLSEDEGQQFIINAALPSLAALKVLLRSFGFTAVNNISKKLKETFSQTYQNRYCVMFEKTTDTRTVDLEESYTDPSVKITAPFGTRVQRKEWKFDDAVSEVFVSHARQHIPKYDEVINQCVDICKKLFNTQSQIVDIGCATGETLRRLHKAGFTNLTGVEASDAMLKQCDYTIANYKHSDRFPQGTYDAVLCNWTLHFIKDKVAYLNDVYRGLNQNGILILSDKTANSGIELELYHDFKRKNGVSEQDIQNKAYSVKDIMFIDSPLWYLTTLNQIGFKDITIINSAYCFTTILAHKYTG